MDDKIAEVKIAVDAALEEVGIIDPETVNIIDPTRKPEDIEAANAIEKSN